MSSRKRKLKLARPFEVVVFDLTNTLLWAKAKWRAKLVNLYRRYAGLPRNYPGLRIREAIRQAGVELGQKKGDWKQGQKWPWQNALAFRLLNPSKFEGKIDHDLFDLGLQLHEAAKALKGFYVAADVLAMLRLLQGSGVPLYIGSNHDRDKADSHIREHGLDTLFPPERRFIGEDKPQESYVRRVVAGIGVPVGQILHVGNSPEHDVPLVMAGMQVVLFDHDGYHREEIRSEWFQSAYGLYLRRSELMIMHSVNRLSTLIIRSWKARAA